MGSADFLWFWKSNISPPNQPKDYLPSGDREDPPSSSHLGFLHLGQSSFLQKSAEAFTTGGGNSLERPKLKLIFNLNHLQFPNLPGTREQVSMVLTHFCTSWGQRYQCPSVLDNLCKNAYVITKPHKTEMMSTSKTIQLMSSFRAKVKHVFCPLQKTESPEPEVP